MKMLVDGEKKYEVLRRQICHLHTYTVSLRLHLRNETAAHSLSAPSSPMGQGHEAVADGWTRLHRLLSDAADSGRPRCSGHLMSSIDTLTNTHRALICSSEALPDLKNLF